MICQNKLENARYLHFCQLQCTYTYRVRVSSSCFQTCGHLVSAPCDLLTTPTNDCKSIFTPACRYRSAINVMADGRSGRASGKNRPKMSKCVLVKKAAVGSWRPDLAVVAVSDDCWLSISITPFDCFVVITRSLNVGTSSRSFLRPVTRTCATCN